MDEGDFFPEEVTAFSNTELEAKLAYTVVAFIVKFQVDKNLRFMILMDGVHPEMDTCIIVEYKGTFLPSSITKEKNAPGRKSDNHLLLSSFPME